MIAQQEAPSRRETFRMVAALSAIAVSAPIGAAALTRNTSAWDRAMRDLKQAQAALEADSRTFDPLAAAWRAGRPAEDAVDWPALADGRRCARLTYDLDAAEALTRRQIARGFFHGERLEGLASRRLAAYDQVRAFRQAQKANDERHGYDAAADRNCALSEAVSDCEAALVAMPAPDLAALLWKIEHLVFDDGGSLSPWTFSYGEPMLRDARRLLGAEA